MSENVRDFSFYCPFCKKILSFSMYENDLQSKYQGGLAEVILPSHGDPPHTVEVYIDKDGLIRGAYPNLTVDETKTSLQFHYITDSTIEIAPDEGKARGVEILPFTISIDDGPQRKYLEEIFFPEIYENYLSERRIKTQPVAIKNFLKAFRNAPSDKPTIVLLISKRYSEGLNNALAARDILVDLDPDKAKMIHIVDSKTTGPMMQTMMYEILAMDEEGKSLQEIIDHLIWVSEKHISYIYVDSLDALRKSERVGSVTTFFGNLLGLKPVIIENENNNGDLKKFKTVRSKAEAIVEITKAINKEFKTRALKGAIFYGIKIDDAQKLSKTLETETGAMHHDFSMGFIGSGVAIHLSYDLLGISFYPIRK